MQGLINSSTLVSVVQVYINTAKKKKKKPTLNKLVAFFPLSKLNASCYKLVSTSVNIRIGVVSIPVRYLPACSVRPILATKLTTHNHKNFPFLPWLGSNISGGNSYHCEEQFWNRSSLLSEKVRLRHNILLFTSGALWSGDLINFQFYFDHIYLTNEQNFTLIFQRLVKLASFKCKRVYFQYQ